MEVRGMSNLGDQRSNDEYLRDVLKAMSPLWLLNWVMSSLTRLVLRQPERMASDTFLSFTQGIGATPDDLAAMNAQADSRRSMLENSPAFHAAFDRIRAVGVTLHWADDRENSYTARLLRLIVPPEAFAPLQEMAADDAGIEGPEPRREAAELFRRWLLQSYHPDWKAYQERWPLVEQSPYNTARNDFGRDPNPIRP